MWPELVIVSTPILHLQARVVKAHEPVSVQALSPELAVETLDVAVVRRLAWAREVEHDTLMVGPQIKISGDEFTAIIDANGRRITDLPAYSFERLDHILAPVVEACIDCWREAREGIDHRQHPDLAPGGQLVMNEIHRPDVIGMGRLRPVGSQLRLDPTLGNLVAELQVHLLVKATDLLRVDGPAVTLDQDMHTPIAVAHPCLADVFDLQLQFGLLAAPGLVESDRSIFSTEHARRIETFQSALTVSTSLRLRAGFRAF